MKDLKETLIKLIISAIILAIAFAYFEKKPQTNTIDFNVFKKEENLNKTPTPAQLQWHDPFKGVSNVPSNPKPNLEEKK